MCILCVASRWSRRIVTMLPWLIIPLIIVWSLSQLLPPGFRFEVTSPRLACVGVLLLSLGWYEMVMPRLSQWRARRNILLRERQRIEALEAAKWRKEAIRRCRNCLYAYREQTPCGGRFMCTYCGHVSKRPVLDLPNGVLGSSITAGGSHSLPHSTGGAAIGTGIWSSKNVRGWGIRGWAEKSDSSVDRGGLGKRCSGGWGNVNSGSWVWSFLPTCSWAALGLNWVAEAPGWGDNVGFWFKNEFCSPGDHGRIYYLFKCICLVFLMLKWVLTKRWTDDGAMQDDELSRRGEGHEEDLPGTQGSRMEKAKRKAEERRLARLERKRLEEEERKQREEVARLVEERRRLRDEQIEAERETEREAAAEREREIRREREAERRRQEKAKEREKAKEVEVDDAKKRNENGKDSMRKCESNQVETEIRAEQKPLPSSFIDPKRGVKAFKTVGTAGLKGSEFSKKGAGNCQKITAPTHFSPTKSAMAPASKLGLSHSRGTSFWGKSFTFGGRSTKVVPTHIPSTGRSLLPSDASGEKLVSSSSWNKMPWTKVWGKPAGRVESSKENKLPPAASDKEEMAAITEQKEKVSNGIAPQRKSFESLLRVPSTVSLGESEFDPTSQLTDSNYPVHEGLAPSPSHPIPEQLSPTGRSLEVEPLSGVTGSAPDPIHIPISMTVLPPISAPQSSSILESNVNKSDLVRTTIDNSLRLTKISSSIPSSSLNTGNQLLPVLSPLSDITSHMGTLGGSPSLKNCIGQNTTPKSTSSLESSVSKPHHHDLPSERKWEMWDAPQLTQLQVSNLVEPLWALPSSKEGLEPKVACFSKATLEFEKDLPSCLLSPRRTCWSMEDKTGPLLGSLPLPTPSRNSLWSDRSAFQSALRIWEDSDSQRQVPPEFVDCITREIMLDPVITADGHTYERLAIEFWLKTHDTSPITGEVLPPPPGGDGTGVDKTLRPNHILRGQIIEYKERAARGLSTERNGLQTAGWSTFNFRDSVPWSTMTSSMQFPCLGDYYNIPGSQSLWAYDVSKG